MHFPRPLSPQTQELFAKAYTAGFSAAMDEWAYPVGFQYLPINYYGYFTTPPCDLGQDINQDGDVDVLDLIDLLLQFGAACP